MVDHLSVEDATVSFNETVALCSVSLSVHRGDRVAVVGPSGSGKSTLLHLLAGLVAPTTGTVSFNGRNLADQKPAQNAELRRSSFGFVFQHGLLLPDLLLAENVGLPVLLAGGRPKAARSKARELLDSFGIGSLATRMPGEVSGGEAQRAAICRALINDPEVIFADEPTGALDSANAAHVVAMLLDASQERKATLVMVTHQEALTAQFDRFLRLADGTVSEALATEA